MQIIDGEQRLLIEHWGNGDELRPYGPAKYVLVCFTDDEDVKFVPDNLHHAMPRLMYMHIFCFVF